MYCSQVADGCDDAVDVVGELEHQVLEVEAEVAEAGWDMPWSWVTAVGLKPPPRERLEATGRLTMVMC